MASITLNASHLKATTIQRFPMFFTLPTSKPTISFTKATPCHRSLRSQAVASPASVAANNGKSMSKHPEPSRGEPLKIAIVGFGNFGRFIAKGVMRQGHNVLATSRSDYSDYCQQHGIQFFR